MRQSTTESNSLIAFLKLSPN